MTTQTEYKLETMRSILANTSLRHYCVEIGPDMDGLDLVEIRWRNSQNNITERMTFEPSLAKIVAEAMLKCASEITPINL